MARRVFLHIGLPKTGTTYLQTILWQNRDRLRAAGVLLPGAERRDHLWASMVVREDANVVKRHPTAPSSWERLVSEVAAFDGDAVISHEFFASASAEQAAAAIAALAPAEVHVVATGRDALGLFTASWQESIKNKGVQTIGDYSAEVSDNPVTIWNWRALDLALVLDRWTGTLPPAQVHVLPLQPGSRRELLWERFAGLIGVDASAFDLTGNFPNESMGVAETETLRRVNQALDGFETAMDRGVWIRSYLADERLVPRKGERYWPGEEQIADCRRRSEAAVAMIRERGFDVIGDADDLLVPAELPERRHPDSVTDAEVAAVAVDTIAVMLADVRRLTNELGAARRRLERSGTGPAPLRRTGRVRALARRSATLRRIAAKVRG